MKLPNRDDWVRMGYTGMGVGAAYLWNRMSTLHTNGYGYIPPAALATLIILNDNSGNTEKDIAASILGFTSAAQAISFLHTEPTETSSESSTEVQAKENPTSIDYDSEMAKLNKIRTVAGTLGALADIVGKFRGNG
mgnify:CR=1 FL=1|tara:strand:- start:1454 stop:1861 length:408 start_codon:yes stop_codon:yes gene_type:complete